MSTGDGGGADAGRARHARLRELFAAALALPPDERGRLLDERCGGDAALQAEVEALLAADATEGILPTGGFPTDGPASTIDDLAASLESAGFRILRLLGHGGMATVHEAEQESPRRRVALKILRHGLGSPEAIARFRREAELLARFQHPGIAQVHASGVAEGASGPVPYIALELVRGETLVRHAELAGLNRRERLELLADVADSVQHAHGRGIVHRDLKPANILVDEAGRPRVLDFGIAKLLDDEAEALRTQTGAILGTIAYMSPEQVEGRVEEIDVRTDVYSLGVIAFELLGGRHPLDLEGVTLPRALRLVAEEEPVRLGALDPSLGGDLEAIVARALEKDPARRYQTAHELAEDLRRHLNHEPVQARPLTPALLLGKFARRHRVLVGGVLVSTLLLVAGTVGTGLGFLRARDERDAARDSLDEADRVTNFLSDTLSSVDPAEMGRNVLVRDVLDSASKRLGGELADLPRPQARLRETLGTAYLALGEASVAEEHLRAAAALREAALGPDDPQTLGTLSSLGTSLSRQARYGEANALYADLLARYERSLGLDHAGALAARVSAAELTRQLGDDEACAAELTRVLASARIRLGPEHPTTLAAVSGLSVVLQGLGRLEESEALLEEELTLRTELFGPDHPDTLVTRSNLGANHYYREDYERANEQWQEVLERRERVLGPRHPRTLKALANLAELRSSQGRIEEAVELLERALPVQRELLGSDHPDTSRTVGNLAGKYYQLGRHEKAVELWREAVATQRRTLGDGHPSTLTNISNLAHGLRKLGRLEDAERLFREAVERGRTTWPNGKSMRGLFQREHGRTLHELGRNEEALVSLNAAREIYLRILGPDDRNTARTEDLLSVVRAELEAGR